MGACCVTCHLSDPACLPVLTLTWLGRRSLGAGQPDWLAIIAAGGGIGITPEGTTAQYRCDRVVFRPLRDAPPIAVQVI